MADTVKKPLNLGKMLKSPDLGFTIAIFGIVILLILPIPPVFMDMLLALSISLSLLILLIIVYVEKPASFSVFPTILLSVTLFRLGLNVATTRLILIDGYAGSVIDSFGNFVVQGNYIVGAVIFLILIIINFIVITKGAGRIAEVAARFTLDAMPGKQMSIDAELNAGLISEDLARSRRAELQKESEFYGAMDGASKFVRGDAVAGILITLVNVIGGITIGMLQKGMGLGDALQRYTLLSIGDGLVSQVPSLIVSVAAGILVTRTSEGASLGTYLTKQVAIYPRAILGAGCLLFFFAVIPGMPFFPFLFMSCVCFFTFNYIKKNGLEEKIKAEQRLLEKADALPGPTEGEGGEQATDGEAAPKPGAPEEMEKAIQTDIFAIELGYGLLNMADRKQGGDLLDRITGTRTNFAREYGLIVGAIAVRDNVEIEANCYRFVLRGKEVARGEVLPNRQMAMNVSGSQVELNGIPCVEPVFGLDAVWITEEEQNHAEINGYTVVDAASVLITHLSDTLKELAHLIVEREDVQKLVDMVKDKNPTLVNELLPDNASIGLIHRVTQNLLKEKIPIKNFAIILEVLADYTPFTKNPDDLSEQARRKLSMYFVQNYENEEGKVNAVTLDPHLEQYLASRVRRTQFEVGLMMDPQTTQHIIDELNPRLQSLTESGSLPVLVTSVEIRLALFRFLEPNFPRLNVLSYQELPASTRIENFGVITAPPNMPAILPQQEPAG
ncbi:MAG: flagellar biosynthesis protein FlhA [Opitutales bacterium]|nr:flagellar biosynthesis protein FlhA [Opitutales bacterium]NRA26897.1 flagellar biosynthesis protein FlhA [Opitutales bacterium]